MRAKVRLHETVPARLKSMTKRTGIFCCYISRVENGHIVPAIEALEKIFRALEVPMYQLFGDGQELPEAPIFPENGNSGDEDWASHGKGKRLFIKLRHALSLTNGADSSLLMKSGGHTADRTHKAVSLFHWA
jgi:transcriptional regulator with XRE-family HTH domain